MVKVRGKGLGYVALQDIEPGVLLISEAPILVSALSNCGWKQRNKGVHHLKFKIKMLIPPGCHPDGRGALLRGKHRRYQAVLRVIMIKNHQ